MQGISYVKRFENIQKILI